MEYYWTDSRGLINSTTRERVEWVNRYRDGEDVYVVGAVGFVPSRLHESKLHMILGPIKASSVEMIYTAIDVGTYEEIYERIDNTER
jgi:hypothetical protein